VIVRRYAQRGFTLIEVLAAIVLLSLAFAALLGTLGRASRLAANADAHTRAALCAQSALDSAFALTRIRTGVTQGRCDAKFRWQLHTRRWQPQAGQDADRPAMQMYRLDLTVTWGRTARPRHARFSTLRAQMPSMGQNGGLP
jgi:general secretion pathway protein I